MTLKRDLAWKYLDLVNRSSVAYQYARYALGINYDLLPEKVVHQAKRCLLDAVGCSIGAHFAPGRQMYEAMIKELGGIEEATVFGSGLRTSSANAILVNSFLVRFLDFNDLGGGGHNSDSIPAILAVSEREKSNGKDFLASLIISYELGERFAIGIRKEEGIEKQGVMGAFMIDIRGGLSMPPTLGRLMKLNEDQIANAIGICASHSLPLGVLDADREENSMSKNMRFGWVAYDAIIACILAKQGFTGPVRVIEGQNGLNQAIFGGGIDIEKMMDFSGWHILEVRFKPLCISWGLIGSVLATLSIMNENDLKYDEVADVRIRLGLHNMRHHITASKKYPRNAESADHSAYYANAVAIKARRFGPDLFESQYFTDPVVLDLIEKMKVEVDADMPSMGAGGKSIIVTRDGHRFEKLVDKPHGAGDDPLTDTELEDKFRNMAEKYMDKQQIKKILDTIWNLEKLNDMNDLTKLLVFHRR